MALSFHSPLHSLFGEDPLLDLMLSSRARDMHASSGAESAAVPGLRALARSGGVDLVELPGEYALSADLPGLGEEDIVLEISDSRVLTLSADKKEEVSADGGEGGSKVVRRRARSFRQSILLPEDVDSDAIAAHMEKGVLTVRMPKRPKTEQTRRIAVGGGSNEAKKLEA